MLSRRLQDGSGKTDRSEECDHGFVFRVRGMLIACWGQLDAVAAWHSNYDYYYHYYYYFLIMVGITRSKVILR